MLGAPTLLTLRLVTPHARFEAPILGTVLTFPPSLLFLARPIRKIEGSKAVEPPIEMASVMAAMQWQWQGPLRQATMLEPAERKNGWVRESDPAGNKVSRSNKGVGSALPTFQPWLEGS